MKFNPVMSMHSLFTELLKYETLTVIVNPTNQAQLVLSKDPLLMNETDFKKFFAVKTETCMVTS